MRGLLMILMMAQPPNPRTTLLQNIIYEREGIPRKLLNISAPYIGAHEIQHFGQQLQLLKTPQWMDAWTKHVINKFILHILPRGHAAFKRHLLDLNSFYIMLEFITADN